MPLVGVLSFNANHPLSAGATNGKETNVEKKSWHIGLASLALVVTRVAVPVLAAIAAGARWDVALLAALGVEAGLGSKQ